MFTAVIFSPLLIAFLLPRKQCLKLKFFRGAAINKRVKIIFKPVRYKRTSYDSISVSGDPFIHSFIPPVHGTVSRLARCQLHNLWQLIRFYLRHRADGKGGVRSDNSPLLKHSFGSSSLWSGQSGSPSHV